MIKTHFKCIPSTDIFKYKGTEYHSEILYACIYYMAKRFISLAIEKKTYKPFFNEQNRILRLLNSLKKKPNFLLPLYLKKFRCIT